MSAERTLRLLFFVYFTAAGTILVLAPWSPGWDFMLKPFPFPGVDWLRHPLVRAAFTGFGLMHLVWGFHDLLGLFVATEYEPQNPSSSGDQ